MAVLVTVFRAVHIAGGAVALGAFWIPIAVQKGTPLHRNAGKVYAAAMAVVAVSAWCTTAFRIATDPSARQRAIFLSFVALLAVTSVWIGLRAVPQRRAPPGPVDLGLPALLVAAALGTFAIGYVDGATLLMGFAPVGILVGVGQLRWWRTAPAARSQALGEHIGGMIGAGIGTHTAFVVVNADRFGLTGVSPLWVWLAPTLVGVPFLVWARRKWAPARPVRPPSA